MYYKNYKSLGELKYIEELINTDFHDASNHPDEFFFPNK